jgi:hypothetical protein
VVRLQAGHRWGGAVWGQVSHFPRIDSIPIDQGKLRQLAAITAR